MRTTVWRRKSKTHDLHPDVNILFVHVNEEEAGLWRGRGKEKWCGLSLKVKIRSREG